MGYDEDNAPSPKLEKKGHGCFFWGCITSLIILVIGVLLIGGGLYYGYRYLVNMAKDYSETAPATLPPATMPVADRKVLHERFDAFTEAVKKDEPVEPIILTADDLNALIDDNPDFKGTAHVTIEGNQIKAEVSLPLRKLPVAELADRYLNGSATLRVSLQNGVLDVRADSLEIKGKPVPPDVLKALREQNLTKDVGNDPEQRKSMEKIDRLEVKDGKIIITPRKVKAGPPAADPPPGAAVPPVDPPPGEAVPPADPPKPAEKP